MALQSARLADGSAVYLPGGVVQLNNWEYVVDADGQFWLSTNPGQSVPNFTANRDVRLASGQDRIVAKTF